VTVRRSLAERAAVSGQGLSLASVQFGRRGGAAPTMCLTERDLRLMVQLLDVNYLTTSQLVILGWGASRLRAAQKRLKLLHDAGYLDRFRPLRKEGSAEWIYRLSRQGWKELVAQEMTNGSTRFKQAAFTSIAYTEHDVQLSSLVLQIAVEAGGSASEGLIDMMPFHWRGPRSALSSRAACASRCSANERSRSARSRASPTLPFRLRYSSARASSPGSASARSSSELVVERTIKHFEPSGTAARSASQSRSFEQLSGS
jgi:predicted transcriptional regulator